MPLEFGNLVDIEKVQRGIFCKCGHSQYDHRNAQGECTEESGLDCTCQCGNQHKSEDTCACEKFVLGTTKFNVVTGIYQR